MDANLRRLKILSAAAAFSVAAGSGCYSGIDDAGGEPWGGGMASGSADTDGAEGETAAGDDGSNDGGSSEGSDSSNGSDGSADSGTSGGGSDPTGSDVTDGDGGGSTGGIDPMGDPTGADPTGGDPTGGDPTGGSQGSDVPDSAYCQGVADWDPQWAALEAEILTIVNQRRSEGANCGSEGSFGAAGPLTMEPALRCSSRVHSKDMATNNYFDHTNQQGESPFERMQQAGYSYSYAGENIAGGNSTAAATMNQWMDSDGHCANVMNPNYEHIGVGYHPGGPYGTMWTQNLGAQ